MKRLVSLLAAATLATPIAACTDAADLYDGEQTKSDDGKADSSALATFVDATFSGKLVTDASYDDAQTIQDQLLFTVGQLNGMTAVGRVDRAVVTNIKKTTVGGRVQITYDAKLPIAWGHKASIPATIALDLPLDISSAGQDAFAAKYRVGCNDNASELDEIDAGSMFYFFRPLVSSCKLAPSDIHAVTATLSPSPIETTGKFPEYDKVWADGTLNVVAIFGKFADGTTANDVGIDGFNQFVAAMKSELGTHGLVTVPAAVPTDPGVRAPDIEFSATLADGKKIHVVALLTDNVDKGLAMPAFRARYESLSSAADFIVYNGHAGLGTNIRSLANAGKWVKGQYVVVYMNGCDSYAYIDDALSNAHKAVNPDDTTGYKYIDIAVNGMPAFFASMSGATMAMFRGLLSYDNPQTYQQIFAHVDDSQVVLVTGEADNTYTPGAGSGTTPPATAWAGLAEHGSVAHNASKKFTTPVLPAGTYEFDMTGTGDADLYVRVGKAPTTATYDCRPYKTGTNESCSVTLAQPSTLNVMVRGYAPSASAFDLVGKKL